MRAFPAPGCWVTRSMAATRACASCWSAVTSRMFSPFAAIERLMMGDFRTHTAEDLAAGLSGDDWRRLPAGEGSKGPRLYDWARLRLFRLQSPAGPLAVDPPVDRRP